MNMRISWPVLAGLAALGLAVPHQAATVTITSNGGSVQSILAEASKQTGLVLDSGQLKEWPMIVKVKEMPSKQFLEDVAKALDAEWTKSGETFVLSRGLGQERLALAKEAEERIPKIKKSIDEYLKENTGGTDWSDAAIDKRVKADQDKREEATKNLRGNVGDQQMTISVMDSSSVSPANLFLIEALQKIPVQTIASVAPGDRLVMSNNPTKMQKPLPYRSAAIDPFLKAYNKLVGANKAQADSNPSNVRVESPLSRINQPIQNIGKLLVTIMRGGPGVQVMVVVVGPNGEILDRPQAFLEVERNASGPTPEGVTGSIKLSDTSLQLVKFLQSAPAGPSRQVSFRISMGDGQMGSLGDEPTGLPLPEALVPIFSDPVEHEPMSYFVGEALTQLADARQKNLIAYVPDSAFTAFARRLNSGRLEVADLYKGAPLLGISITDEDRILVTAANHAEAARTRVNRGEFGKLIGAITKRGYASLDEICRYSIVMPDWERDNLDAKWIQAFSPATALVYSNQQTAFLRLYGLLTPAQRQASMQRVRLNVNQMSGQQRKIVEKVVYQFNGPMVMGRGAMTIMSTVRSDRNPNEESPEPQIIQQEPTEAFPGGLPDNTMLDMRRQWAEGVFAIDKDDHGRFLSGGDLGLRMGIDTSKFPAGTIPNTDYAKYQMADLVYITMDLRFGRRGRSGELRDATIRKGADAVAYDKLPKSFLDVVDKARQQAANMKMGTVTAGGRGVPPPP